MNADISLTSPQILWGLAVIFAALVATVLLGRYYFSKRSEQRLAGKHLPKRKASILESRNKYPEVNVFHWSSLFLRIGLVVSLGLIIAAFNWTTYEEEVYIPEGAMELEADIDIEPPRSSEPPPPPPPPPPPVIEEVPEGVVIEEEDFEFVDQSVSEETAIVDAPVAVQDNNKPLPPPPPPPPPPSEKVEEIFKVVEDMPRFPGCEAMASKDEKIACSQRKLLEFIYKNIKYPEIARENGVEGTVVIRFVVEADGRVNQAEILRDIGAGCGDEAKRVVEMMNNMSERWVPGKQRGRAVRVYFNLPVKFVLKAQ